MNATDSLPPEVVRRLWNLSRGLKDCSTSASVFLKPIEKIKMMREIEQIESILVAPGNGLDAEDLEALSKAASDLEAEIGLVAPSLVREERRAYAGALSNFLREIRRVTLKLTGHEVGKGVWFEERIFEKPSGEVVVTELGGAEK